MNDYQRMCQMYKLTFTSDAGAEVLKDLLDRYVNQPFPMVLGATRGEDLAYYEGRRAVVLDLLHLINSADVPNPVGGSAQETTR